MKKAGFLYAMVIFVLSGIVVMLFGSHMKLKREYAFYRNSGAVSGSAGENDRILFQRQQQFMREAELFKDQIALLTEGLKNKEQQLAQLRLELHNQKVLNKKAEAEKLKMVGRMLSYEIEKKSLKVAKKNRKNFSDGSKQEYLVGNGGFIMKSGEASYVQTEDKDNTENEQPDRL